MENNLNKWHRVNKDTFHYNISNSERYVYNFNEDMFYQQFDNEEVEQIDFEDMNEHARETAYDIHEMIQANK